MMKRLLLIATLLLVMMPAVKAQSFEFRYHGQPLADGATVTIEAEKDEWGFGEMCCYTNPSSDPDNGLILKLLSGNTAQGTATVTIDENTFNPSRILWCMGGNCMTFGSNTSLNKDFTVKEGRCQVQFDAEDIQSEGHLLATLTATIGGETHTVKIFFAHNEPELSFEADGLFYKLYSDGASVTVASGGSSAGAVIIPESVEYNGASYLVTAIAPQAFQNCSGLSAVIIPGTVTSIGDYAFRYSGLTFVAIPQSVTSMGSQVFYGCSHLQSMLLLAENCDNVTTGAPNVRNLFLAPSVASIKGLGLSPYHVYSYGSVPPVCDGITFNSYSGTLHVPRQGLAPYFADEYWGNFNNFSGDAVWPATVNLTMSQEAVTMKIGETAQLTATSDSIPSGMSTLWFSTNPAVVEVSGSGSLVAKATGEATVIALCGEHFATCQVTVEEETVTISLDKSELTLNMDDIATITPSHTPSIVPVEYTFTCSDNEVILTQWKNGAIRLLATKPGTAVITVSSTDGNAVPATCEVTVRRPVGDVDVDGRVTTVDVTCLYNHLLDSDDTFAATSDVDGDGYITTADITAIYNILIGNAPSSYHEYVDLGLPSGTLWATMNVGANSPEEYGDYFAWGETTPKDVYNWSTYKWCMGSEYTMTKYCTDSYYGYNGFVDNKTELDPEDDAATVNWGPEWRMPSEDQIQELMDNCTTLWTTRNGVNGRLFTSNINGASLFLPAAGNGWLSGLGDAGSWGSYWSRTLYSSYPYTACSLYFNSESVYWGNYYRNDDFSVRPVCVSQN